MDNIRLTNCCGSCGHKFVIEDVTRTPSKIILFEANKETKAMANSELEMKARVWAAASPPIANEESMYPLDLIMIEKANALRNGKLVLKEDFNIQSFDDDEDEKGGEDVFTNDDDDDDDKASNYTTE